MSARMSCESPPPTVIGRHTFPGKPIAVGEARTWAEQVLREHGFDDLEDTILLVSEIVTNAVVHTFSYGRSIDILIGVTDEAIIVEVLDDGSSSAPRLKRPKSTTIHGRGLTLVEALASKWGTDLHGDGGRSVWFEMSRHG